MLAAASSSSATASGGGHHVGTEAGNIRTLRVVLMGAEGATGTGPGKSALVERFLSGRFAGSLPPNKVAGVRARPPYVLKGHAGGPALGRGATTTTEWRLAVQLVELPSARPALAASAPVHLPTADAVVFVYDCADRRTFEAIESLRALAAAHARPEALRAGSGLLLGTKADLERDRKVAALEAVRLGQRLGLPVFECSAMSGVNVEAALASLVRRTALRLALAPTTGSGGDLALAESILQHLPAPPPLVPSPEPPADAGGASVSLQDDAFTLLHHACALGAGDAARALLLRKGADANPHDARGRTPLHVAVLHAHVPCVRALLWTTTGSTGGANNTGAGGGACEVTALDGAGRSPLALAESLGNTELAALLGRAQASYLYAEAMRAGAAAPFKSRVALLGAGGAGKTALWRALRGLPRKDPATGRSPPRTLLFEESRTTLGELERLPDPHEGGNADQQLLTPNSHALIGPSRIRSWQRTLSRSDSSSSSSSSSLDDSGEYGLADGHGTCAAFTVQLIQTLLGMRGRQQQREEQERQAWAAVAAAASAGEAHPLASPHLYPNASEEEAGEVAVHCVEVAGGSDAEAVPLQPLLLEGSDVVVLCFDLVRAQLNREEALRDLAYYFAALDSQAHRPGTPRAGVVSPGRQGGKGPVFHRRDLLLVGTFRDALPVAAGDSAPEDNDSDADSQQRARALEELSLAICQRLAHHEAFARLRVPAAARAKGRVFFAVGADASATGDELGALRRALCKAVARNGALRRSRPAMWLRFLDEIRCDGGRRVLSREQCRQVADRLAYEYTNRPARPEDFALMLRLLGEMGEIMVLDLEGGEPGQPQQPQRQQVVLPRREYAFHLYRKIVEKCREAELSPRRRSPTPADLHPAVQRLRATGRVPLESLRALLGPEDGAYLEIALCAFERAELGARLPTTDTDGEPEAFLPGIPLAQNEDDFASVAALDSPAGAVCDPMGGKVACYYAFREALVPKGLLARLLLAGMRPAAHALGGLRFTHRLWGPPSTLAKDHAELPLDGYTLALTVDRGQSRLRCALLCQDGRALTPGMEAQAGLIVYDLLEALRKQHHARFRLDLLVADCASRRAFELVGDVLVAHKRRLLQQQQQERGGQDEDATASPRPAPDAASPDPRPPRAPQGSGNGGSNGIHKPTSFSFGQGKEEATGEGGGGDPMGRVLHWAAVLTTAPASAFRPLPRALTSSAAAAEAAKGAAADGAGCSWVVQPLIGRLCALLPPTPDPAPNPTPNPQRPQPHILAPHPGGPRRRNKASAYAALLPPDHPAAAHALWRLEPVTPSSSSSPSRAKKPCAGGFRLRLHRPGGAMDGWGLGLSSSASEKRHLGQIYAVLCADAGRAAVWSASSSSSAPGTTGGGGGGGIDNALRLRWGDEHRFLTEGAHDARLPEVRFLVLTPEAPLRRSWGFDPLEPSTKPMSGPTAASLLSTADDAEQQYYGSNSTKPPQRRSSRSGSLAKPPLPAVSVVQQARAEIDSDSEEEQDALALRPQESAGDEGDDEEGDGEANSPEIRRAEGAGVDAAAAAALRDVASALTLDDGED